jgi:hypothetical protein
MSKWKERSWLWLFCDLSRRVNRIILYNICRIYMYLIWFFYSASRLDGFEFQMFFASCHSRLEIAKRANSSIFLSTRIIKTYLFQYKRGFGSCLNLESFKQSSSYHKLNVLIILLVKHILKGKKASCPD